MKTISWKFFVEDVAPQIAAKLNEDYKQTVKAYLAAKGISVVGEDGKAIDFDKDVTLEAPKVEDAAAIKAKADAEAKAAKDAADGVKAAEEAEEQEESLSLKTINAVVTKAVGDAVKPLVQHKLTRPQPVRDGAFVVPGNVKRYGRLNNFKGVIDGKTAEERAYRFGMWAMARVAQDIPGRFRGPGFDDAQKFVGDYIVKLQSTTANTQSGYLVPPEFGMDLIDLREQFGVARRVLKVVPMASDTRSDPRRTSGLTSYFVAEGGAGTESNKGWDRVVLTAKDLMVISRYTAQLDMDAVINIGDDLAGEIAYAFSAKEDDCAFNGDGTSTYGGIVGVRQRLVDVFSTSGGTGLTKQASGSTWGAITLTDFNTVVGTLPQYADTPNATWIAHRTFYFGVMQKVELAAGGVTAREIIEGEARGRYTFLGYPVTISQKFPAATASAAIPAVLGDFTKGGSFGDRQMDSISFSGEASVGGESTFERNEIAIRGTERFDINIHDVGAVGTAGPIVGIITG